MFLFIFYRTLYGAYQPLFRSKPKTDVQPDGLNGVGPDAAPERANIRERMRRLRKRCRLPESPHVKGNVGDHCLAGAANRSWTRRRESRTCLGGTRDVLFGLLSRNECQSQILRRLAESKEAIIYKPSSHP